MAWTIGVDIGTYETKAALVDEKGAVLASAANPHIVQFPKAGWAEHDAEIVWWQGFLNCLKILFDKEPEAQERVGAICVSGVGPCVLPVDKEGNPLRNAILYGVDTRATKQIDQLNEHFGEDTLFEKIGVKLSSQATAPKILWIKENEPEIYRNADKFVGVSTFINQRLTQVCAIDHFTAGSNHGLYDPIQLNWSPELTAPVVDNERLPEIFWSNDPIGTVTSAASKMTVLREGTIVVAGTIDAAAEALSATVINDKEMMLMYGSTHFMIQVTSKRVTHPQLWSGPYLFPGTWALLAGMSTTGSLTRWVRDTMGQNLLELETKSGASAYSALTALAEKSPVGSNGILMLPYFSGERTPINDPHAKGLVIGLSLSNSLGDIYRAALEGVGFGIGQHTQLFREIGAEPSSISAVGGGTKSSLWLQIVSDITGVVQKVYPVTLGACFGDAFMAAMALNASLAPKDIASWQPNETQVTPNLKNKKKYSELASLFSEVYKLNKSIMHQLHRID